MVKVAYICDCNKKCNAYRYCGDVCRHTFDEFHAKNGIVHDVGELTTDRFRKVAAVNETVYYEEVIE